MDELQTPTHQTPAEASLGGRPPPLAHIADRLLTLPGFREQAIGEVLEILPVVHRFTPGLYIRQISMPSGAVVLSKVHLTEHPFVVSKGRVTVWTEDGQREDLEAPHIGVTVPGTRRLLVVHEDTIWTTFHPTDLTDPVEIERRIVQQWPNGHQELMP